MTSIPKFKLSVIKSDNQFIVKSNQSSKFVVIRHNKRIDPVRKNDCNIRIYRRYLLCIQQILI